SVVTAWTDPSSADSNEYVTIARFVFLLCSTSKWMYASIRLPFVEIVHLVFCERCFDDCHSYQVNLFAIRTCCILSNSRRKFPLAAAFALASTRIIFLINFSYCWGVIC